MKIEYSKEADALYMKFNDLLMCVKVTSLI